MAIKVPSEIIPNATDQKVTDAKYVKHTHHEGESDEEIMTQSSINESVLDGNIFKTINGNSIVGEGNIYTSTDSYVECESLGNANPKVVTIVNYQQVNGGNIRIKFDNHNTASPTSPDTTIKLRIITDPEDSNQYVEGYLYYNNAEIDGSVSTPNTWSDDETVAIYYDGTNYMANNVAGSELKTAATTNNPDTKKGLTESALVEIIGNVKKQSGDYVSLQDQIYEISASSSTVAIALYNDGSGSNATVRYVGDSGSTETHKIYGTCNPSTSIMTLYKRINGTGSWTAVGGPTQATNNSGETLYQTGVSSDVSQRYDYYISNQIYSTLKNTGALYVYYVLPVFYGALPTTTEGEDPEPITYTLDQLIGLNGETALLTKASARTSTKATYSMNFDTRARKVYMVCPKTLLNSNTYLVTPINPNAVYWMSVISSNIMPFAKNTTLENSDYFVYVSNNTYTVDPQGQRNIIFQ